MAIPVISGHPLKKQPYSQDKTSTPQVELNSQLGVFLHNTIYLDKTIEKSKEFDDLRLFIHPSYIILNTEI